MRELTPEMMEELHEMNLSTIAYNGFASWVEETLSCNLVCCPTCLTKIIMDISIPQSMLAYLINEERYEEAARLRDSVNLFMAFDQPNCGNYNPKNYKGL